MSWLLRGSQQMDSSFTNNMRSIILAFIVTVLITLSTSGQVLIHDAVLQGASLSVVGGGSEPVNPISFVQTAEISYGGSYTTTTVKAFTNNVTVGSCLVAAVNIAYPGGLPTGVTDSAGNTWTYVTNTAWNSGVCLTVFYFATNAIAGATTVTCTLYQSAPYCQMIIAEYSGVKLASPIDVYDISSGTGGAAPSTLSSPSVTATTTNGVAIGYAFASNGPLAAGTGYTLVKYNAGGLMEHKIMTASGAIAATCTDSTSSDTHAIGIVVFKHQ